MLIYCQDPPAAGRIDLRVLTMKKTTSRTARAGQTATPKKSSRPAARPRKAAPKETRRAAGAESPSARIDARIAELGDWRGDLLSRIRAVIRAADPEVVEEWKWDTPVWSHDGILCTGEVYKDKVKMTFAKGASLKDPSRLFNSSLDGVTRRAIDVRHGDALDPRALKALVRAAVAHNRSPKRG
jgi:hypothetical protein